MKSSSETSLIFYTIQMIGALKRLGYKGIDVTLIESPNEIPQNLLDRSNCDLGYTVVNGVIKGNMINRSRED